MLNLKQKAYNFFNGYLYPLYVAFFVAVGHIFSAEIYAMAFIVPTVCAGFILCKDLKFFISPLLCFYYIFSRKGLESEAFYSTPSLIAYGLMCFAVLVSGAIHFIVYRKEIKIKNFTSSALSSGLLLLAITFLFNGFSSIENYNASNFIFGLLIIISFVVPYFLFSINLEINQDTKNYLLYVLVLSSIVIIFEFLHLYFTNGVMHDGTIMKGKLDLGWGISNNIGSTLAILMPIHFYCAIHTKHTLPFFISGVITYVFVLLSLSRAAILFATPILIACILFLCIYKHKHRKQAIISASVLAVVTVLAGILFKDTIYTAFKQIIDAGFNDSGRFPYYQDGINKFFNYPILGIGFGNSHGNNNSFVIVAPNYFHNTIIQVLASCGIVGFAAYSYHRCQTIQLLLNTRTPFSFFVGMSVLALLLTSLLDIHLFNIFPTIIYSTLLCIFERCTHPEKILLNRIQPTKARKFCRFF